MLNCLGNNFCEMSNDGLEVLLGLKTKTNSSCFVMKMCFHLGNCLSQLDFFKRLQNGDSTLCAKDMFLFAIFFFCLSHNLCHCMK